VLPRLGSAQLGSAKHGSTKKGRAELSQSQISQLEPAEPGLSRVSDFRTDKESGAYIQFLQIFLDIQYFISAE
jgi:hypothetical protein